MKHLSRAVVIAAVIALAAGTALGALVAVLSADNSSPSPAAASGTGGTASPAASTSGTKSVADIYAENVEGVVEIKVTSSGGQSLTPFGPSPQTQEAQGTGFEVDSKGDIVTNAHVVSGATSISVATKDGKTYKATLVGSDPTTDVAVIHIDASSGDLHPLTWGDSTQLRVGDPVVAIGDPFGLADSVSAGIVSALDRTITSPNNHPIENAIQTDAAINHGNSGGPLLNGEGQVIGITSQIYADQSTSGNVGIGFAVPSATVEKIASELISHGKAAHAYLGVYLDNASDGARIARVTSGSPAAKAGLKAGDVITAVDGTSVSGASDVVSAVTAKAPGDSVTLTIQSGGSTHTVQVTLGTLP
jgi:putative serine protease PepD